MADIMVRVTTPDYDTWLRAFSAADAELSSCGVHKWTIYRDSWNSHILMVHFIAENLDQALKYFHSPAFHQSEPVLNATEYTLYIAQKSDRV
ncbi:MAG: hypothetical protein GC204_01090 [Chloroflexi bacterium]|nr:hypothetical protein [Chloroflexota bacterium]